ncbi:polypeptide N-acetylgalactosaminyltransferase 1-like [Haliotis asinina]|uniref:polypeptide N-acetylgalactosaminyltransferase 1-like n=1 Tax=Haliotis asinina TaxID=109174 RepID=UPI003531AA20
MSRPNSCREVAITVFFHVVTTVFLLQILAAVIFPEQMYVPPFRRRKMTPDMQSKPRQEDDISNLYRYQSLLYGPGTVQALESQLQKLLKNHERPGDDYYGFNVTRSDEISATRHVIDERPYECKNKYFEYSFLPTLSVVTPFHNVALTPFLRHVHAIVSRTPPQLLLDVILVDDNSTFSYLGEDLQEYFRILNNRIRIIRNKERKGLILSRLRGAEEARGDVVVFLDAHMEVCEGWVEPLLEKINSQPAIVVQADITQIDENTLDLKTDDSAKYRGGFGWDMRYMRFPLPQYLRQFRDADWKPFSTPVLQGSCIAVRKDYFKAIGQFDPGLEIWGGEHFDLSFNVWMTGGRIETVPCSKVGHIYKNNNYSLGSGDKMYGITKNILRVAEIWMDEYKHIVRAAVFGHLQNRFPSLSEAELKSYIPVFTEAEEKSLRQRQYLRKEHNSQPFAWFLKAVMPEQKIPLREYLNSGEIINEKTRDSFFVFDDGHIGTTGTEAGVIVPDNTFSLDRYGRLKYEDRCVGYDERNLLVINPCPFDQKGITTWKYDNNKLVIVQKSTRLCATQTTSRVLFHTEKELVQLLACDEENQKQNWTFTFTYK